MVDVAERFAAELMDRPDDNNKKRENNRRLAINDIAEARALGCKPFWLTYNCDWRGRVYGIPHFNYMRQDHVRAMFRFENGMALGKDSLRWLEINCANCAGQDKERFKDRRKWVSDNRKEIEAVAADPFTAAKLWHDKDEPFRYVAACRELAAAWRKPGTFVTHLPIPFDGSCNGLQHLSLLSRDKESGARVNLAACDKPRDIYTDIAVRVRELIERDETAGAADWQDAFKRMDDKKIKIRKLIKQPAMTYAYGATDYRWGKQLKKKYEKDIFPGANHVPNCFYLAKKDSRGSG